MLPAPLRSLETRALARRAARALERQLAYQEQKARDLAGHEAEVTAELCAYAAEVRARIEAVRPLPPSTRVLDVGSGPHGLVFFFGLEDAVGVDPLADAYARLFPAWQARARTVPASGEALPFPDASFDLVLSDNVLDHAPHPAKILDEIARVLRPGGLLYVTVHVHHPLWRGLARVHAAWTAAGVPVEIAPFASHTVHLTVDDARAMLAGAPFRVLTEDTGVAAAEHEAFTTPPRHAGDRLKRLFFKNARYEVIAERRSM